MRVACQRVRCGLVLRACCSAATTTSSTIRIRGSVRIYANLFNYTYTECRA
ncbi:hypothetical protein PF008_g4898 [Phytophthora fragariae]|uniref:Uncharacterized protein n=1 Tax=Phytophthora fragariae TaxID=53985 RepID=A0A6G0SA22_9STRA|nr:hypothetical protein PF008_g4898 [Phytophthora fragariae]